MEINGYTITASNFGNLSAGDQFSTDLESTVAHLEKFGELDNTYKLTKTAIGRRGDIEWTTQEFEGEEATGAIVFRDREPNSPCWIIVKN